MLACNGIVYYPQPQQLLMQQILIEGCVRYKLILLLKEQMSRRVQRRVDKENSFNAQYVPRSRTPVGANTNSKAPLTPSNSQLRKKLDENYQKLLSNDRSAQIYDNFDYQSSKNRAKRPNAKNRGFDQKVTNISTINDKINSLLNMVKKDKQNQRNDKLDKLEKERTAKREIDSPSIDIVQKFRKQQPNVSPFTKDKYQESDFSIKTEKEQRYSIPEIREYEYEFNQRCEQNSKKIIQTSLINNTKQAAKEQGKDLNLKHLRRKYLPDQQLPVQKHKRQISGKWEKPIEEQDFRYEYSKNYQRVTQSTKPNPTRQRQSRAVAAESNKPKNIDKMLQQRKKKREQQRQQQRAKFQQSIKTSVNNFEADNDKKSATLKQSEAFRQYQYTNPTEKNHNLTQINPTQENHRNQKINTATRLIDQQIEKIKNKIQQSQNNTQKNQKKLSGHKKGLSSSHIQNKQHTTKMAIKISSQVQLDTKLRQARLAFDKISGEQKWKNLQQDLQNQGMKVSLQFIKQLVKISSDQRNPFAGQLKGSQNCSDIASLFVKAQSYWESEVCGATPINDLIGEGFNTEELDLSQKGNLGLQDLVCFINLYTGHFYRNRDLALIFRRLQLESGESGNSLTYQGFQKTLTV